MHSDQLDRIADALSEAARSNLHAGRDHNETPPDRSAASVLCDHVLGMYFPGFFGGPDFCQDLRDVYTRQSLLGLEGTLLSLVERSLRFDYQRCGTTCPSDIKARTRDLVGHAIDGLPAVAQLLGTDIQAAFDNDPAAVSHEEIVASYPGLVAIAVQRTAHLLYALEIPILPRMMTEVAHSRTGIDIHPGAHIGESFAIDHGTGIVIGETTTIGKHCMLYHGVTLGAFNPLAKNAAGELTRGQSNKRHPDLDDHVTVYPGATILGGDTRIGHHSVIGGNVWLTQSVEPYSRVTIKDPELVIRTRGSAAPDFVI